jgi:hypothetical protein
LHNLGKAMLNAANDKLSLTEKGEFEMPATQCQECRNRERLAKHSKSQQPIITIYAYRGANSSHQFNFSIEGVLTCHVDGHKWPITLRDGVIDTTSPTLPMSGSANLSPRVPPGIKQDVEEAERDHFSQFISLLL